MRLASWGKILGVAVLVAASVAVAAEYVNRTESWRYKMTVEVETPEGIKTGFAVREVTVNKVEPEIQGLNVTQAHVKGEAVVIDLGKRGVLFAVPANDYSTVFQAFPMPGKIPGAEGFTHAGLDYYSTLKNARADLPPKLYPWLVMFKDINDPKSVIMVKGGEFDVQKQDYVPVDRFAKIFGDGVILKNVMIEMTEEPITWQIDKWLPWLNQLKGGYLHGGLTSRNAPYGMHGGYFKSGDKK